MFSEFGDAGEHSVVGGLVDEDSMIGFLFGLALGPFLSRGRGLPCGQPFSERRL